MLTPPRARAEPASIEGAVRPMPKRRGQTRARVIRPFPVAGDWRFRWLHGYTSGSLFSLIG